MRDVYRGIVVLAAVAAVAVGIGVALPSRPDEAPGRSIAAPSTAPSSGTTPTTSGPAPTTDPNPTGPAPTTGANPTGPALSSTGPAATSGAVRSAGPAPSTSALMGSARPTPSPGASLAPGYTAMEAFYADPRIARLPRSPHPVPQAGPARHVVKDTRTGLAVPRMTKPWKLYGPAPFTSRQVLPKQRGADQRGMLVSCPLPIEVQQKWRDTALLAARWTLNMHPKGATIGWISSQAIDHGWMLIYQVKYGKHSSRAAVAVLDGGMVKPGLVFVTVPDTQRKQWQDVRRVVAGVRVLG